MTENSKLPIKDNEEKTHGMGIRWNLFVFLAFFIAFVLIVVWVFQVLLLTPFYKSQKLSELKLTASLIETNINSTDLQQQIYTLSSDYSTCIILYEIRGEVGFEKIKSKDVSKGCLIHNAKGLLTDLYADAVANGGEINEYYSLAGFKGSKDIYDTDTSSTIYVKVFSDSQDKKYAVFLDSKLAPVSATIKTYMTQFHWICIILFSGALILSLLMSKVISTPIIKLNRSVKKLAAGDYDEVFDGKGYREIKELSDALNYASSELSKNDRLQKELIANISHDLRTPLTMIRGYSEMMRDIPGENTAENAQVVIDETARLSELVGDMLDLSKIRAGTRGINKEVFDLTETVAETMKRYEKLVEKDGYNIEFDCDDGIFADADRTMMLQVMYNLINNAVNYTGADKKVEVKLRRKDGSAFFSVTDTGAGISPEELPLIWDRYYKVDKVHRRAAIGTGLGLSIVKEILEAHSATYGVDSRVGSGSTFWFRLDIAKNDKNSSKGL